MHTDSVKVNPESFNIQLEKKEQIQQLKPHIRVTQCLTQSQTFRWHFSRDTHACALTVDQKGEITLSKGRA